MSRIPVYPYRVIIIRRNGSDLVTEQHNYANLIGATTKRDSALRKPHTRKVEIVMVLDEATPASELLQTNATALPANGHGNNAGANAPPPANGRAQRSYHADKHGSYGGTIGKRPERGISPWEGNQHRLSPPTVTSAPACARCA